MIPSTTVSLYSWDDLQNAICDRMGIDRSLFRDYHKVINSQDYLDLWHVALDSVIPSHMTNGSAVLMWPLTDQDHLEWLVQDQGAWTEPFFRAYEQVMEELDPTFQGVWVVFIW